MNEPLKFKLFSVYGKSMGLVTGEYMKIQQYNPRISIDEFINFMENEKKKRTSGTKQLRFFQYAYAK